MGSYSVPVVELDTLGPGKQLDPLLKEIKFKKDLLKAALLEQQFLKEIDSQPHLYERKFIHRAVYRWEHGPVQLTGNSSA